MRLLVFSDSHGVIAPMEALFREISPDMVMHLGDHDADALELKRLVGGVPVHIVRGNCDYGVRSPDSQIVSVDGLRLFITHGHRYNVKRTYDSLLLAAKYERADAVLFGHTHRPLYTNYGALSVINPGSFGYDGSYAVLETGGGVLTAEIKSGRDA